MNLKALWLLLLALTIAVATQAADYSGEFYHDDAVQKFFETGSADDFVSLNPEYQIYVLAHLAANPDNDNFTIQDRDFINEHYLKNQSPDFRANVDRYAFQIAVQNRDQSQVNELFIKGTRLNSKTAYNYVCEAFRLAGRTPYNTFDEKFLSTDLNKIKILIPLVASVPGLPVASCNVGTAAAPQMYSMTDLLTKAEPSFYNQLAKQIREVGLASQTLSQEYSNCREPELRYWMGQAMIQVKPLKLGQSSYVIFQDGKCVVNGLIKKIKNSNGKVVYDFSPSNGIAGYMKNSFQFTELSEIIYHMKSNPNSYRLATSVNTNVSTQLLVTQPKTNAVVPPAELPPKSQRRDTSLLSNVQLKFLNIFYRY